MSTLNVTNCFFKKTMFLLQKNYGIKTYVFYGPKSKEKGFIKKWYIFVKEKKIQ